MCTNNFARVVNFQNLISIQATISIVSFIFSEFNPYAHITFECVSCFQNLIFTHTQQFLPCFSFSFFFEFNLCTQATISTVFFFFELILNTKLFQHLSLYFFYIYIYELNLFFLISSSVEMF